jgi:hypothetical protein
MVMGGWVLFRAGSFEHAWGYYGALFGSCQGSGAANVIWLYGRSWEVRMALAAGVLFSMPLIRIFRRWRDALRCVPAGKPGAGFILICAELGPVFILLGLLALCFLPLSSGTYNPFIYFRF